MKKFTIKHYAFSLIVTIFTIGNVSAMQEAVNNPTQKTIVFFTNPLEELNLHDKQESSEIITNAFKTITKKLSEAKNDLAKLNPTLKTYFSQTFNAKIATDVKTIFNAIQDAPKINTAVASGLLDLMSSLDEILYPGKAHELAKAKLYRLRIMLSGTGIAITGILVAGIAALLPLKK